MGASLASARTSPVQPCEVEDVLIGTKLVAAMVAESLASLDPPLTMPQWRVLVVAEAGGCNVTGVAQDLGVHISNATRTCDRLVEAGLLERRRATEDRRHVLLALTPRGQELYDGAMQHRRRRIADAMRLMSERDRTDLARTMTRFVEAAEEARRTGTPHHP